MKIKHKKGKWYPQWHVLLRIFFLMCFYKFLSLFGYNLNATYLFNRKSILDQKSANQQDWLKTIGTKTLGSTETRKEEIAAFRTTDPTRGAFSVCNYYRTGNGNHYQQEEKSGSLWSNVSLVDVVKLNVTIDLKYWIIVFPYAGGDQKPENDFEYDVKFKLV